jgi:tRNA(Arg) A34 adenosine deaminase TadA
MPQRKIKQNIKKPREKKFHRQVRIGMTAILMCLATLYYLNITRIIFGVENRIVSGLFVLNVIWTTLFIYWWNHISKKK